MKNKDVVRCWSNSLPSSSDNLYTDGQELFSYGIKIGYTYLDEKILYRYSARYRHFVSQSTISCLRSHINLAKKYADKIEKLK